MGDLLFKRVTTNVHNVDFNCGVESINEYVKESYFPGLVKHAYAYSISVGDKILGYYQLMLRDIVLDDLPDELSEYDTEIRNTITAVHIRFLAIDLKYQRHRIGTQVMRIAMTQIRELSKIWPVRIITIDAVVDKIAWYERLGFKKTKRNSREQEGVTEAMYFDCMSDDDFKLLDDYFDSIC